MHHILESDLFSIIADGGYDENASKEMSSSIMYYRKYSHIPIVYQKEIYFPETYDTVLGDLSKIIQFQYVNRNQLKFFATVQSL